MPRNETICLDGDGSFGPTVGWKLLKPSAISLGATVRSNALNLQPPWRRAKLFGALAPPWRRAEPATRCAEPASFASDANRDWIRSPVHSSGSSSLSPQPNRAPKGAMDSSSYGAHAYLLGAIFGVRAAEDGHLTLLSAPGCVACQEYWLPTHQMNASDTGDCAERGPCA